MNKDILEKLLDNFRFRYIHNQVSTETDRAIIIAMAIAYVGMAIFEVANSLKGNKYAGK